jgi:hypothetical protein
MAPAVFRPAEILLLPLTGSSSLRAARRSIDRMPFPAEQSLQ